MNSPDVPSEVAVAACAGMGARSRGVTLINANRMRPPIAPIGLDYVAGALRQAGIEVELLDLCLAEDPAKALQSHFAARQPEVVGISFRNIDDCFWPGEVWFVPELAELVATVRDLTRAPIVLGGVGFSIFPEAIVARSGADFGIYGDGEQAIVALVTQLRAKGDFHHVPGLICRDVTDRTSPPAWPVQLDIPTRRDVVDNAAYFRLGGQIGVETRRGCDRSCIYCADPLAKGSRVRRRDPAAVADEFESLLAQGVDVFHLCDSEFNLPAEHARDVCDELIRRRLGERVRWYAYLAVLPFDGNLAQRMRRAGCVGINFTSDSASPAMLAEYRQPHGPDDLAAAVRHCREARIAVMLDLLLGGPGETPHSVAETIGWVRRIEPDCAGVALGIRLYPGTVLLRRLLSEGKLASLPGIRRRYSGPIDLLRPTFYLSPGLGERPAQFVRGLIAGDPRFFEPAEDLPIGLDERPEPTGYNYHENLPLVEAIAQGARGAYWDILRQIRHRDPTDSPPAS